MFIEVTRTNFPPNSKPIFVWDGKCGFCKYWVLRLKKYTNPQIDFKTFQDVNDSFPDIPIRRFEEASRLIEPTGRVFSGPDSFYRSLIYRKVPLTFFNNSYSRNRLFESFSNFLYNLISKNRNISYKISTLLFGKNPLKFNYHWLWFMFVFLLLLIIIFI
ncbi:Protein of unknown function, DUF393 [Flavobacteriaceae bacterium MAR_2010_188]|nr:Protein of unknown function, DUF393 [Flavobacteriaceae bacterium MAR_2010_188]